MRRGEERRGERREEKGERSAVASIVSMDWWRRVASIASVMMMVLRSSFPLMEAQRNTRVKDFLLLRSWASTTDAQKSTKPRETAGFRSPRRVDRIVVNEVKDCLV